MVYSTVIYFATEQEKIDYENNQNVINENSKQVIEEAKAIQAQAEEAEQEF